MTEPQMTGVLIGGWTETRDGGSEWICDKSLVEEKTKKIYQEFRAIQYRTQVVNGTNYLFKVCVGGPSYIHLLIHKALGGHQSMTAVQEDKTKDEPLEPFNVNIWKIWSHTMYTVKDTQWICDQVRPLVQRKTNKIYEEYRAVLSRLQSVNGTNFLFQVRVGDRNYIHVQVHQALPCDGGYLELRGVQENKTKDEPLEPISD